VSAVDNHDEIQVDLGEFLDNQGGAVTTWEFPVPSKNGPVGFLDLLFENYDQVIAFEVKSYIDSIGETIRQVRKYEAALPWCDCPYQYGQKMCRIGRHNLLDGGSGDPGNGVRRHYSPVMCVVSPDDRFQKQLRSQKILFWKYPETTQEAEEQISLLGCFPLGGLQSLYMEWRFYRISGERWEPSEELLLKGLKSIIETAENRDLTDMEAATYEHLEVRLARTRERNLAEFVEELRTS
jgi:hypothetical protein